MPLPLLINLLTGALFAGGIAFELLWLAVRAAAWLRFKGAFPELVQNTAGGQAQRALRRQERDLLVLATGALFTLVVGLTLWIYGGTPVIGVWMWVLFGLACALFVAWWVFLVRDIRRWLALRHAARASAAFGSVLLRLNLQNHRVFHDVPLGDLTVDHLVMGSRGVFAIKLVARRVGKESNVVRINGRSIEFQDGHALLDTIALAERCARAVADLPVKGLSHRLHVLPVVAVPGWEIAPAQGQAGETFLVNEKTALMLLRASKPADYLMEADMGPLQEQLSKLCIDQSF